MGGPQRGGQCILQNPSLLRLTGLSPYKYLLPVKKISAKKNILHPNHKFCSKCVKYMNICINV